MPRVAHYRVTIGGVFGSSAAPLEKWQTSVLVPNATTPTALTAADALGKANAIKGSWDATVKGVCGGGIIHEYCDIRLIGADGLQPRNPDGSFAGAARFTTEGATASGAAPVYPAQIAVVASLITARQGPSGKGRMFLPPPAAGLGADFRLGVVAADLLAAAVKDWINAVNVELAGKVSVVSSKGLTSPVTGVQVGRVLDTHRSRRRDLLEAKGAVALIT
jgi:hypothetical protein